MMDCKSCNGFPPDLTPLIFFLWGYQREGFCKKNQGHMMSSEHERSY